MLLMTTGDPEEWGFIPSFLDEDDPRPAKEQFNARYIGGWNSFKGFTFDEEKGSLKYPGDPVMHVRGALVFRDEIIMLFPHAWVLILHTDHTWDVARMD